ncbi:hypothetical protein PWT90_05404 [Aphanocladium album]|nr:hypothetical protein PWT90_05404 [Aphanocladium album]
MDDSHSDATSRREELIAFATKHLNAARACVPELEALLEALAPKVKSIHATGLISFTRDLKHDVCAIEAILEELRRQQTPAERGEDEADLDVVWKQLEPRTTGAHQSTIRWRAVRRCANLVAVKRTFQGSSRDSRRAAVLERSSNSNSSGDGGGLPEHERLQMHRVIKEQTKTEVAVVDRGARWVDVCCITAVRLVLPNLVRGVHADVDVLLEQLPRIDPGVQLVVEDASSPFLADDDLISGGTCRSGLDDMIRTLVGDSRQMLTDTLNLEHTVLVDLISDLTHLRLASQPWQSRTTRAQIQEENARPDGVMAPTLYPLLRGRRLVCTHEAAEHFHEMLATVGTPTERERGRLLVPYHAAERDATPAALRARFDALSERPPPTDVQFPVEILSADERWDVERVRHLVEEGEDGGTDGVHGEQRPRLPQVALEIVCRGLLKSSKLSTYMYGWHRGIVTVTSNKEIRAHMKTWVEAGRRSDDDRGPQLYCVEVTRNLLAKSAHPPPGWVCAADATEG